MMTFLRKFIRDTQGTTAVEFGLIAGAFLLLVFGIFEMGRAFYTWNLFQFAVEKATRYALVQEDPTNEEISEFVLNEMNVMSVDKDMVTLTVDQYDVSGVDFIEVSGTYRFSTVAPLLPGKWSGFNLPANSRLPIP